MSTGIKEDGTAAADGFPQQQRQVVLTDVNSVVWWAIQTVSAECVEERKQNSIGNTLDVKKATQYKLDAYLADRVGWVEPLQKQFSQVWTVKPPDRTSGPRGHVSKDAKRLEKEHRIESEVLSIAGEVVEVQAYRKGALPIESMGAETTVTKASSPSAETGKEIKKIMRYLQSVHEPASVDLHVVVWFQPKQADVASANFEDWEQKCLRSVEGFVDDRMAKSDLIWEDIGGSMLAICTPWATFATWSRKEELPVKEVLDARVRHLVLDPVILATAQLAQVKRFVSRVANLDTNQGVSGDRSPLQARDDFYRWRAEHWWEQPAKSPIASKIWNRVVDANNIRTQVDSLSSEMSDYALVEEERHNRSMEEHNVALAKQGSRLAVGGLVFAVVAIFMPLAYEEAGLAWALAVGAVLGIPAGVGMWLWQRRHASVGPGQADVAGDRSTN